MSTWVIFQTSRAFINRYCSKNTHDTDLFYEVNDNFKDKTIIWPESPNLHPSQRAFGDKMTSYQR